MNFKRKISKRQVRCTMCTQHRWKGNAAGRRSIRDERMLQKQDLRNL